ncbi:hypothetical protein MMC18_003083 [Xylographa bjoerkii]|nr:hypothetical protein [Xylographa bjoerkii]
MDLSSREPVSLSAGEKRSSSATRLPDKAPSSSEVTAPVVGKHDPVKKAEASKSNPKEKSTLERNAEPGQKATERSNTGATKALKKAPNASSVDEASANATTSDLDDSPAKENQDKTPSHPATPASAILQSRPFIIRTFKHDGADGGQVTGSILSQSLDKVLAATGRTDAGTLTMAGLRKLVPQMSRYPSLERFCTPSGTLIDDEAISFTEYLVLEEDPAAATPSAGTPSLMLYFRSTKLGESAGKGADGNEASAVEAPNLSEGPSVKVSKFAETGDLLQKSENTTSLVVQEANESGANGKSAGTLHENQWAVVLRNCAVFYGWIIDPVSKRIVRAPKPAFRLRSKVDQTQIAKIPDFVSEPAPQPVKDEKAAEKSSAKDKDEKPADKTLAEDEDSAEEDDVQAVTPKSEKGIPNFRVSDDSRIEITAHEDELTVSMAKSDFSEQSTEASVSGGGYGVSVGVSAGYASSRSKTSKSMDSSTTQTIVARYMFPRCELLLWPDEMEPTEELAGLIETIRTTKNIKILRKLQAEYGQLFCQRVTLGGRLLSTKLVTTTEKKTLEEAKESFKTSVGASVSGGFGGFSASASFKHEQAQGNSNVNEAAKRSQNEAAVFEAVGGDTILANNPPMWCATVGNYANWRVINRDGLSSLVEVLSAMPGYEAVQSWFVQAVPALSRYMVLNEAHECKARLRVTSPTNSLSIPNAGNNASFYLGHDVNSAVTPRLNGVSAGSSDSFWMRIDITEDIPIFNPPTYRAPTILGYDKFDVEGVPYGAEYNAAFVKTEWTIIAPFDEELMHGTRVILRTTPFQDPNAKPEAGGSSITPNVSHIVVFRNAQGEFLPAMSDSDEFQYWRILKTEPSQRHIKPGDEVRLAWDFRDQTTGWRDFTQDVFGRRQVCAPASHGGSSDVRSPLFLKVPWPRFETSNNPTTLIMSSEQSDLAAKAVNINNRERSETAKYCLQDLKLRIDNVANNGRGDAEDYLINKLRMEGVNTHLDITCKPPGPPMQMRSSIFWFGIW